MDLETTREMDYANLLAPGKGILFILFRTSAGSHAPGASLRECSEAPSSSKGTLAS